MKIKGKVVGKNLSVGEWLFFDEQGKIIKKIDEDAKFGKIEIKDLLKFIEKEGHINLETGEGLESAIIYADGSGDKITSRFNIALTKKEKEVWGITIFAQSWNNFLETVYIIDKDTGEVLCKESKQKFPVM